MLTFLYVARLRQSFFFLISLAYLIICTYLKCLGFFFDTLIRIVVYSLEIFY